MIPLKRGVVLIAAAALGACASAPSELTGGGTVPAARVAASSEAAGSAAESAPATEATLAAEATPATEATPAAAPMLTVDANQLAQLPTITCREVLKQGSNVIVTYCLTQDAWKLYDRREALEAQEIVRMMQGFRYR